MPQLHIAQLRIPKTLTDPQAPDFLEAVEVSRRVRINTWGNDDLAYTGEDLLAVCHDPFEWYVMLVARHGARIVGVAGIAMPLDENTELAHVTMDVLPELQGRGIGRELLAAAETFVRGENRRVVKVETNHTADGAVPRGGDTLDAEDGNGHLPLRSRETQFAASAGYSLERVERFSARTLPLPAGLSERLDAAARAAHGAEYAILQWVDRCPDEWAADVVTLEEQGRFVETSHDGLGLHLDGQEGVARLREGESLALNAGRHILVSAAQSLATGRLVALTSISVLAHRDDVVFQDDTIVAGPHRGREVGLKIKLANLDLLSREFPRAKTVYTWNASGDAAMRSVNERLGFALAGVTGQWHKGFDLV